jgi:hypothetical protein
MKLLQVIPVKGASIKLKSALNKKERELRDGRTTFYKHNTHKWKHTKYYGWIDITETSGGILIAKIQSKVQDSEWQMLQAFLGYLERHLLDLIESITITYRKT